MQLKLFLILHCENKIMNKELFSSAPSHPNSDPLVELKILPLSSADNWPLITEKLLITSYFLSVVRP